MGAFISLSTENVIYGIRKKVNRKELTVHIFFSLLVWILQFSSFTFSPSYVILYSTIYNMNKKRRTNLIWSDENWNTNCNKENTNDGKCYNYITRNKQRLPILKTLLIKCIIYSLFPILMITFWPFWLTFTHMETIVFSTNNSTNYKTPFFWRLCINSSTSLQIIPFLRDGGSSSFSILHSKD